MKNIVLIYNPKAGDTYFKYELDNFLRKFSKQDYDIRILRSRGKGKIEEYFTMSNFDECEAVFVAGGDGTVNEVINGMMKNNVKVPVGIIPAGTANDFARHLKMPLEFNECFKVLSKMKLEEVDLGSANGQYFVNICCGGLFTNVSQNIDIDLKNTLGKLAYYIKGAEQLPNFKPIHLKIETSTKVYDDMFYLFLVLNSSGAGGFEKLSKHAEINDGYLDFIGIRALTIKDMPRLFMKILRGDHLDDKNVLFIRDKKFRIESYDIQDEFRESDIDGEKGPELPLDIKVVHKAIKVIIN